VPISFDIYPYMNKGITYDSDLNSDYLRWFAKTMDRIGISTSEKRDFKNNYKELDKLQKEILIEKDAALAYFFAVEFGYQTHLMQKLILERKSTKYAFHFALNVSHADIKALQSVIANSNKTEYITKFACFIPGANRKLLEPLIIEAGEPKYAHMYLKYVKGSKGSNLTKLKEIIMESGKPSYLFELAKHLTSLQEIEQIEDLIIQSNSFTYMRLFAEKVKNANVEKIERAVLASDNSEEIKKFAKYVKKSRMKQFLLVG